ncbi:HPP family protein [Ideonella sp.]|uniref:HPP family protein n=1 Tax=Ideonella sp. TaxID=1929293 RepID=UPI002B4671E3|nr:HPP family protein [Ideonella sp.]HJV71449.1 HPP family protein [Ideonella sp.]
MSDGMKAGGLGLRRLPAASWRDFLPPDQQVDAHERWRASAGALLGVLFTAWLCHALVPAQASPLWLVAPIGASAVLVFALPASPFAQPWSVVGGNTLSALVGIACVQLLGVAPWSAALAVGLAIAVMFALRCLHPPGGACALLMVLGGVADPSFALQPVLLNSVLLMLAGVAYNRLTGRAYPQRGVAGPKVDEPRRRSFTDADLDAVLARYNQVLDISREDLHMLLEQAQMQAWRRRSGQVRCAEVMSAPPISVSFGTPLHEAWALLRQHRVKSLPVTDRAQRVVGIVTLADFMREARVGARADWERRLAALIRPSGATHGDKVEVVGQIMTRQVRVVSQDRPIGDLLPLFSTTGHHHVPVIDGERRLAGMITQSDVVRALAHHE